MEDTLEFYSLICCECGISFAIPKAFVDSLRESHDKFCCPHGHRQSFTAQTEGNRLREELEKKKSALFYVRGERRAGVFREIALKGQVTKLKNKLKKAQG